MIIKERLERFYLFVASPEGYAMDVSIEEKMKDELHRSVEERGVSEK